MSKATVAEVLEVLENLIHIAKGAMEEANRYGDYDWDIDDYLAESRGLVKKIKASGIAQEEANAHPA